MSIVGTRPPLISETNLYEPRHKARLAIKPGITGMWQVSGVSNVHTTVISYEDAVYCAIQNGGLMAIPDGGPLSTVGKKRGHL